MTCSSEIVTILKIVRTVLNIVQWVIPILLIVLVTFDLAKIVTTGNNDEKLVKEAQKKAITRVIYAVVIFLIPLLVKIVFDIVELPSLVGNGNDWHTCWESASN